MRNNTWGAFAALSFGLGCSSSSPPISISYADTGANADTAAEDTAASDEIAVPGDVTDPGDGPPIEDTTAPADPFGTAGFPLSVDAAAGTFALGPVAAFKGGKDAYAAPVAWRKGTETVQFLLGFYTFEDAAGAWTTAGSSALGAVADVGGKPEAAITLGGGASAKATVLSEGTVALEVSVPTEANRTSLAFQLGKDAHILGLGAQTPRLDHRGHRVPIWVTEEGVGKQNDLAENEFSLGLKGHEYDAYFPVPFYVSVTPHADGTADCYGLLVEGTERIVFEFGSANSAALRIERWAPGMRIVLFWGATPADVVSRATLYMGRPPMPPAWSFLPWIGAKGGAEVVRGQVQKVKDNAIPASAIWSEDWLGEASNAITGNNIKYHWELDPTLYPDFKAFTDELHGKDLKFLGYFNPFITTPFKEWTEANENGYLPTTPEGHPYEMTILTNQGSIIDLTKPEARAWLLGYMATARDLGLDGWMADYAEWVPYDAHFADGRTGAAVSSDYPLLWQDVNRQACSPADGCTFFVRSGYTGSAALSTGVWGGDQNTDFGEDDGLPTAVRIGVGLGLAGVGFYGSDIAGYTSAGVPPTTKELFFRWTEYGAYSPIMRTHEGNAGPKNWWFDEDASTIALFKRYAEVHAQLYPYLRGLMAEATRTGIPPIRHPALHEPTAATLAARDTYLLGPRLFVAPVVAAGAAERTFDLPPGEWVDLRDGASYSSGAPVTVAAAVDEIPVLAGEGALIPRLAVPPLGPTAAAEAEEAGIELTVVGGRDSAFELADGTVFTLTSSGRADPGALGLPDCTGEVRPCSSLDGKKRLYRLNASGAVSGGGFSIATVPPVGRKIDVVLFVK